MDFDFFISYAADDRAWAEWIAWELEDAKFVVLLQGWQFRSGANFTLELQRAPARTKLALLSPSYLTALQTQSEWAAAFERGGGLIPVRVGECDLAGPFALLDVVDLVDLDEADARAHLLAALDGQRPKAVISPVFPKDPEPAPAASAPRRGTARARRSSWCTTNATSRRRRDLADLLAPLQHRGISAAWSCAPSQTRRSAGSSSGCMRTTTRRSSRRSSARTSWHPTSPSARR